MPTSIQLIDGVGAMSAGGQGLAEVMAGHEDYGIVSIMGPQSSGKSTLMNKLFDTPFAVMDASKGRGQTTLGVWAAAAGPLLVLDLQGTDSIEGGEDSKKFERQSSLFALALCDVVVINVWFQDLGRYDAAGMSLLRTVFEVHLTLFGKQRREQGATTLLFLIRDHMEQVTPFAKLEELVQRDIANIWAAMSKPAELESAEVSSFFAVKIAALPHFVYEPDKFGEAVGALKRRFDPAAGPEALLATLQKPPVPLDGLPEYAETLWKTIWAEQDLDLPSQRQILAMHRCAQIASDTLREWRDATLAPRAGLGDAVLAQAAEGLGAALAAGFGRAVDAYDAATRRYDAEKRAERRAALCAELQRDLAPLVRRALRGAAEAQGEAFGAALLALLQPDELLADFAGAVGRMEAEALRSLRAAAEGACGGALRAVVPEPALLAEMEEEQEAALQETLGGLREAARTKQAELLSELLKASLTASLLKQLARLLDRPPPALWEQLAELRAATLAPGPLKEAFSSELASLGLEIDALLPQLQAHLEREVRIKLQQEVGGLRFRLPRAFERAFRLDAQGLPRAWGARDDVTALCAHARDEALALLALYRQPAAAAANAGSELVGEEEAESLTLALDTEAAAALEQARAAQQKAAASGATPLWLLVLLPILGLNEALALLSSPFLLLCLLLLALGAGALHAISPGLPLQLARQASADVGRRAGLLARGLA